MKIVSRISLSLAALASIAAAPSQPRQPTARWVVNFEDAQCVASRNYGTEEKPLFLALKPSPLGQVMRVMLIRKGPARDAQQIPGTIRFGEGEAIKTNLLAYADSATKRVAYAINLPMKTFAANRNSTVIEITGPPAGAQLAVSRLSDVLSTLDECVRNLQDAWNIGPEHEIRIKQGPRVERPLTDLFSSMDYPAQAISGRDSGSAGVVLLVDETGALRDCSVDEPSGVATLDAMSCFIIKSRAKFAPAVGQDGKPARSVVLQRIQWRIEP